tara:strand:- start:8142 stop:8288 length:147 start_codon:yes stop_codon:yes gene_type:complete
MINDDIDTGDTDFLKVIWDDTSVPARILKCLVAVWLLGCIYAIILNFI